MSSTPPVQVETVILHPYSGDYRVDVLLFSEFERWNDGKPVGTEVSLTFSFMDAFPAHSNDEDKKGFSVFNEAQRFATRQILTEISQQFGLTFLEVADTSSIHGVLRFGNNDQGPSNGGYSYRPGVADFAGDVFINNNMVADNLSNVVPGSYTWHTLVHEIGHALGLKHPGNYNGDDVASSKPDNFLASVEDNTFNSIMSYTAPEQNRDFFGRYDQLALKYLYGVRDYHAQDDIYAYTDKDGGILKIINDTGGIDTVDLSAMTSGADVSLRPRNFSSFGKQSDGSAASNNLSIAYDVILENLIGTDFDDDIGGNDADNVLKAGRGSDTIYDGGGDDLVDGGEGLDGMIYRVNRVEHTLNKSGPNSLSVLKNNSQGTDILINIERLIFNDQALAFDLGGNAGQAYRLYQAAFDRKPDLAGLGYWIKDMDNGSSLTTVAAGFFQSAEFQKLYGSNPSTTTLLNNFYQNILHRTPDQAGFDYWAAELNTGKITPAGALASFCEDVENQALVIGSIQNGIEYTPWLG